MKFEELKEDYILELVPVYDEEEAKALFNMAIEHVLAIPHYKVHSIADTDLTYVQSQKLLTILNDLVIGKPIQHILGEAHFYGSVFTVSPDVLIPRPETEELVDWIIHDHPNQLHVDKSILDIGTGSGCIPISLKKYLPNFTVSSLDVSDEALHVAKQNASQIHVDVNFIHADILNYTSEVLYDVIVSNPPYIRQLEKEGMHHNVLAHEPHLALFVSNEKPLVFYQAIADFALSHLKLQGHLYFEINEYLGEEMMEMLHDKGFKNIDLKQDMQGKDRMIRASL